jgi:DNA-binding GntR family transcriptional regulator
LISAARASVCAAIFTCAASTTTPLKELLDALADKDSERARAIAERHVLDAGRSLADWLEQRRTA